jgi:transposase
VKEQVYKLNDWAAVQKVYKETKSKRETARVLGMSKNTVKKLLALDEQPVYQRVIYRSCIDPYKEQIIEWRCKPYEFNGTRIFRELVKIGYTGSIGPLYRFLRIVDEDMEMISSKATERIETPAGDQAQFDWTEYQIMIGGRFRTVYCFSMILAASRKKAICFSLKENADAIYEAIQELFEDLGGVTLEMLIDNPKALVIENDPKTRKRSGTIRMLSFWQSISEQN